MYNDKLKAYLLAKPHIKDVYFDAEGKWYFAKKEGRKSVSAAEVMSSKAEQVDTPDTGNKKVKKPKIEE